jgi:hypothetical protein
VYDGVYDDVYDGVYDEVEDGALIIPGNGIPFTDGCSGDGNDIPNVGVVAEADVVVVAGAGGGGGGSAGRLPPAVEELSD